MFIVTLYPNVCFSPPATFNEYQGETADMLKAQEHLNVSHRWFSFNRHMSQNAVLQHQCQVSWNKLGPGKLRSIEHSYMAKKQHLLTWMQHCANTSVLPPFLDLLCAELAQVSLCMVLPSHADSTQAKAFTVSSCSSVQHCIVPCRTTNHVPDPHFQIQGWMHSALS